MNRVPMIITGLTVLMVIPFRETTTRDIPGPQKNSVIQKIQKKDTTKSVPADYGMYDFTFTGITGRKYQLSRYGGKTVLVNIWAPWCEPCKKETDGFVRLYNRYRSIGFEILGIAVQTTSYQVRSFIEAHDVKYPVGIKDDITKLYKTIGMPASYLFGPDGTLIKQFVGYTDEKALQAILDETFKKFPRLP